MTGYARMDFRMRSDGSVFVLEANANPNLEEYEDFGRAAEHAGHALSEAAGTTHVAGYGLPGGVAEHRRPACLRRLPCPRRGDREVPGDLFYPPKTNTRISTSPMPISAAPAISPAQIGSCVSTQSVQPVVSRCSS